MIYNMISPTCHRLESKHWLAIQQDEIQVCIEFKVWQYILLSFLTDVKDGSGQLLWRVQHILDIYLDS